MFFIENTIKDNKIKKIILFFNFKFKLSLLSKNILKGMKIDKISIFNPLLGVYNYCDISNCNKNEELLEFLSNKIG